MFGNVQGAGSQTAISASAGAEVALFATALGDDTFDLIFARLPEVDEEVDLTLSGSGLSEAETPASDKRDQYHAPEPVSLPSLHEKHQQNPGINQVLLPALIDKTTTNGPEVFAGDNGDSMLAASKPRLRVHSHVASHASASRSDTDAGGEGVEAEAFAISAISEPQQAVSQTDDWARSSPVRAGDDATAQPANREQTTHVGVDREVHPFAKYQPVSEGVILLTEAAPHRLAQTALRENPIDQTAPSATKTDGTKANFGSNQFQATARDFEHVSWSVRRVLPEPMAGARSVGLVVGRENGKEPQFGNALPTQTERGGARAMAVAVAPEPATRAGLDRAFGDLVHSGAGPNNSTAPKAATGRDDRTAPDVELRAVPDIGLGKMNKYGESIHWASNKDAELAGLAPRHRPTVVSSTSNAVEIESALPKSPAGPSSAPDVAVPDLAEELPLTVLQARGPDMTVAPGHVVPTPVAPSHAEAARAVAQQIAEVAVQRAGGTVEIRLNPEELGAVRMTLTGGDTHLTVSIVADRGETAELMRRHIDQLAREFRDIGYSNLSFSFEHGPSGQQHAADRTHEDSSLSEIEDAIMHSLKPRQRPVTAEGAMDMRI
ncbi:flagellar hook-length control protein FliK [Shimia biformata]|uniref:flagellar hook-length control protein FliK n=1 Tax=Shimia biformata TaxID=1294299 RepID=UPI001951561B|nr:flagellar hook-length control protein FliK [Shimia biformata]